MATEILSIIKKEEINFINNQFKNYYMNEGDFSRYILNYSYITVIEFLRKNTNVALFIENNFKGALSITGVYIPTNRFIEIRNFYGELPSYNLLIDKSLFIFLSQKDIDDKISFSTIKEFISH